MKKSVNPEDIKVGVVGLGLMGCSISTCLLIAKHKVIAIAPLSSDLENAEKRIQIHLQKSLEDGMINQSPAYYLENIT
ncbi:MAG: 3-hydroxyacyl-CoA dehydrogenase family protein, partial [Chitinophagia bacterium]|nr:3-hydroxyacyl-CoA dehydrogenase family protein [Chitinophagia bacterium]